GPEYDVVEEPQVPQVVVVVPASASAGQATISSGPFGPGQVWTGRYLCTQGDTALRFIVVEAHGFEVRPLFDFFHEPSGAKGMYLVQGTFDPRTGRVRFQPEKWVVRPDRYVMVGMAGRVSADGDEINGSITHEGCGYFDLSLGAPQP